MPTTSPRVSRFENLPLENLSGSEPVDAVVANIQADILMANACVLQKLVRNEGYLVLSGILSKELKAVEEHFSENPKRGFTPIRNIH